MKEIALGAAFVAGVLVMAAVVLILYPAFLLMGLLVRLLLGIVLFFVMLWLIGRATLAIEKRRAAKRK